MIDYETQVKPLESDHTDPEIAEILAAELIADPSSYKPISPSQVASWLAEDGTEARLRTWLDSAKPTADQLALVASDDAVQAQFALWSGVQGLLRLAELPDGRDFDISPGSSARQLVDVSVATPTIPATESDRDRLIERALRQALPTAVDVAASRTAWQAGEVQRFIDETVSTMMEAMDDGGDVDTVKTAVLTAWGE